MNTKKQHEGLTVDNQKHLLEVLVNQAENQKNYMKKQSVFNTFVFLSVFAFIGVVFFLGIKFFDKMPKPVINTDSITYKEMNILLENLRDKYNISLEKLQNKISEKTQLITQKNENQKQKMLLEMSKQYKKIIDSMNTDRQTSAELSEKYKKQIINYVTEIFVLKKQMRSISGDIARLDNERNDILKKYKKLSIENKKLKLQNKELEQRVRPYLSPQQQRELENILQDDS